MQEHDSRNAETLSNPARCDKPDTKPSFTPMQEKVVDRVVRGLTNKQIAFELGIAEKTVKAHMTLLMKKLNVTNRVQVVVMVHILRAPPKTRNYRLAA